MTQILNSIINSYGEKNCNTTLKLWYDYFIDRKLYGHIKYITIMGYIIQDFNSEAILSLNYEYKNMLFTLITFLIYKYVLHNDSIKPSNKHKLPELIIEIWIKLYNILSDESNYSAGLATPNVWQSFTKILILNNFYLSDEAITNRKITPKDIIVVIRLDDQDESELEFMQSLIYLEMIEPAKMPNEEIKQECVLQISDYNYRKFIVNIFDVLTNKIENNSFISFVSSKNIRTYPISTILNKKFEN